MSAESNAASAPGQAQQEGGRPLAEWVSFGIAAALLALVVGLVIYLWVAVPETPAVFEVRQDEPVRQAGGQYYVPFSVANAGGITADAVLVTAELVIDGATVEEGEQEFRYLSAGEEEQGEFVFSQDPAGGELRLRVAGYSLP